MRSVLIFFFSSRRRHTRFDCDWSSDVCSSDLRLPVQKDWRDWALISEQIGILIGGLSLWEIGARAGWIDAFFWSQPRDRKSVVEGKSVDLGGRRIIKKKKKTKDQQIFAHYEYC